MKYKFLLLAMLFHSCNNNCGQNSKSKKVDFGYFSLDVSSNCKQEKLKSLDSYAGKITCDSNVLYFDYGRLAASSVAKTEKEYIEKCNWLSDALIDIMPLNKSYSSDSLSKILKVVNTDLSNRTAKILYNNKVFSHKISIPEHLRGRVERVDTLNGMVQRLIFCNDKYAIKRDYELQISNANSSYLDKNGCKILILKINSINLADTLSALGMLYSAKLTLEK
jgi:hypothetical protein